MTKHRIIVDIKAGMAEPVTTSTVAVDGLEHWRCADGTLRPMATEGLFSGERFITTRWHDDQAAAYAEAAEELGRRSQQLAALRLVCLAGGEVTYA